MKFKFKEKGEFSWEGLKGFIYSDKDDFPFASAIAFEVKGSHGKVKSLVSNRVYLILEGKGEFIIDGKVIPVEPTDVIIVPKNTAYDYRAVDGTTLKLFLVHTPAFDAEKEVKLE